jgi:hypothetical protein
MPDIDAFPNLLSCPTPFTEVEISKLDRIFGGLWRLPQDSRLSFEFQDASLRSHKDTSNSGGLPRAIMEIGERHTQLDQCGGEFEIEDIDPRGGGFKYTIEHAPHPEGVEEFCLQVPPQIVRLTQDGLPITDSSGGSAN